MNYRLPKSERLHSEKLIKELFNEGSSFFLYPFKIQYLIQNPAGEETLQVLFSVSKKKNKKAVVRNLIKRRMREAYRLNKHLLSGLDQGVLIGLIYVASGPLSYQEIEAKIKQSLSKIQELIPGKIEE
ncbi:ribonuclease P protein component [Algoriphagus sp. CAU 1675]|uniref:ribonuclease P protein component n=1 Tax=Algoriphagus sp. CAU 1675 TaxID=3032597 RepID=UPI0023DB678B|nr:ribonuclease P protein component [Algoriphagus sp. CAU 1675]MDF2157004.1 ribonuclease P protein component [Algoriphagus sp. CAU 1675]